MPALDRSNGPDTQATSLSTNANRTRTRLSFESLEDRTVPSIFTVNITADTNAMNLITGQDGQGNVSLRSAIEASNYLGATNQITLASNSAYGLTSALPTIAANDTSPS